MVVVDRLSNRQQQGIVLVGWGAIGEVGGMRNLQDMSAAKITSAGAIGHMCDSISGRGEAAVSR